MTAGTATTRPAAVVMRASEMPGATARRVAAPAVPRPWKASMMPMTVPKRPMKGAHCAVVASQVMRRSMMVSDSEAAVWAARSRAWGLGAVPRPPAWRWYSSWISWKTATSGLGLNWSAMAAISERRPDLRKARRKRLLWMLASLKARHLAMMMAQDTMLAMSRMPRTVSAVGPLLWTMSTIALECGPARGPEGVAVSCRKRARGRTVICSVSV